MLQNSVILHFPVILQFSVISWTGIKTLTLALSFEPEGIGLFILHVAIKSAN